MTTAPKSRSDKSFVEAVNLAYHEEEAALYDGRHPEIMEAEQGRWRLITESVTALKRARGSISILDLGTGTGFVPRQLATALNAGDSFIVSDLSPTMLDKAEANLRADGFRPQLRRVIGPAESLGLPAASVDVVTMNSVVHHFPDVTAVLVAADRVLKPGGLMIIAHEPNARHFRHLVIGTLDRLLRLARQLRHPLAWLSGSVGDPFIDRVNRRLIDRRVIAKPLTAEEIESIVDIHSPTAGRTVQLGRGFDSKRLVEKNLAGYKIERLLTYQHFGKIDLRKISWLRSFVDWVERTWPLEGALFMMILRKPE